ncbi:MAG: FAD-dependent oxidoreductase, partial [Promethearchaeati archaeon]
ALDIADQGFDVILVERSPSIGGRMAMIDKTFPTLDCSACILTPRLSEVDRHPNIHLLTYSEIRSVNGVAGDFDVQVVRKPMYVDPEECSGCGECMDVCPVELPSEFDQGIGFRKAIYQPFPQATPNTYTIDKKGLPACRASCPAGVNAQGFISLMKEKQYEEALKIVRDSIPFPGVLGRVCIGFCEAECERGRLDESMSVRNLHRFLADYEMAGESPEFEPVELDKDSSVAVIGSGPAGLSCAYHLIRKGYPVTVFEQMPKAGGLLRYAIPEYRLPRNVLDYEINRIRAMGVKIETDHRVNSIEELQEDGFDAIFMATGASVSNRLAIDGEKMTGVFHSTEFLEKVATTEEIEVGEKVAVVGGGDAAVDSARVALRMGASDVVVIYRRSGIELPAIPSEVEDAREEGVRFMFLTQPVEILTSKNALAGVKCVRMRLGEPDHSGRRRPIPIPNSEFTIAMDNMIVAIGQSPDPVGIQNECDCTDKGLLKADPITLETNIDGVFGGGDLVSGPYTAVKAVGHGKEAAESIDRYLSDKDLRQGRTDDRHRVQSFEVDKSGRHIESRAVMPKQSVASRKNSFSEVELGFNEEIALTEAERCLGCANCCECKLCVDACDRDAIDHMMREEIVNLSVGSIVIATGARLFDVSEYPRLGFGEYANVINAMQYERLISAAGPTKGHLIRLSDGKIPKSIGFVQCVGARDVNKGVPYCSRICCMYGIKNAVMAKEHHPDSEVTIYFADIRAFGKGFEEFYEMAKTRFGVNFVRGRVGCVMEDDETKDLLVRVEETTTGEINDYEHDLVILSPGIQPPEGLRDMAIELGTDLDEDGYINVPSLLSEPVTATMPGIFVCGCADGPKDIPDSVSAGSAAAMKVSIMLSKGQDD